MKNNSNYRKLFSIVFLAIYVTSYDSPSTSTPSLEVQVIETDSKQEVILDIVRINNCGGTADTEQTITRSFSTTIEGSVTLKAGYQVVEGSVSAKYGEARNTSKSIKLVAPPRTNMEFTLQWTEQTWLGRVTANGESGNYTARMPISVEQTNARNLGCNNTPTKTPGGVSSTETPNWAIVFEYRFPSGFWSVGTHEYTLEVYCLSIKFDDGTQGGSYTQIFDVSDDADLLSGDVYLRLSGLKYGPQWPSTAQDIERIHPLQTTTAAIILTDNTRTEAELARTDCTVTISWDGGEPQLLIPGSPFQY
ncbi:MAG: hypothetical protein HND47_03245 [Chloroflexi bacterium]|nr:hypothetical protein [Chloroflexota bacterium]